MRVDNSSRVNNILEWKASCKCQFSLGCQCRWVARWSWFTSGFFSILSKPKAYFSTLIIVNFLPRFTTCVLLPTKSTVFTPGLAIQI